MFLLKFLGKVQIKHNESVLDIHYVYKGKTDQDQSESNSERGKDKKLLS